jgi:hypothetical protein
LNIYNLVAEKLGIEFALQNANMLYKVAVDSWRKYTRSHYIYIMGIRWRPLFNKSQKCGGERKH